MTSLPPSVVINRYEAEHPWCRNPDCMFRARATVSAYCPIHDPNPYIGRTSHHHRTPRPSILAALIRKAAA